MSNIINTSTNTVILHPQGSVPIGCDSGGFRDSLDVMVDAFLSDQQVMETSRKAYGWAIRRFFRWCLDTGRQVNILQRADMIGYMEYMSSKGYSTKTVEAYTVAVRRFYGWLDSQGVYPNIAQGVKGPRKRNEAFIKMHLDRKERTDLLSWARTQGLRDYAIVNLMLRNGLRTIEVSRLDVDDITTRKGVRILRLWRKGSLAKDDYVALTDEAYIPISDYLATRGRLLSSSPLFVTSGKGHRDGRMSPRRIQQVVHGGLSAIGLTGREYSPHSLRHTTAVAILESGGTIEDVRTVLGHASTTTSQIYVKSAQEQMRLENPPENIIRNAFGPTEDNQY